MRYYDKITPDGTRDLLFAECEQRSQVTKALKDLFVSQGYRRVMTPALEFYDVFGKAAKYLPKETMYKLTDSKGRLLVLCPDCTVPVARLTATRLKGNYQCLSDCIITIIFTVDFLRERVKV